MARHGISSLQDRIYIGVCVAGYFLFSGLVALIDMCARSSDLKSSRIRLELLSSAKVIRTSVICIKARHLSFQGILRVFA